MRGRTHSGDLQKLLSENCHVKHCLIDFKQNDFFDCLSLFFSPFDAAPFSSSTPLSFVIILLSHHMVAILAQYSVQNYRDWISAMSHGRLRRPTGVIEAEKFRHFCKHQLLTMLEARCNYHERQLRCTPRSFTSKKIWKIVPFRIYYTPRV
jgi:hypothetical protein